ncbi:hypothetical protein ACWDYJ_28200 [Streptomyces sp. NPDC003042]
MTLSTRHSIRAVPIGGCVEHACSGALTATVHPDQPRLPAEITCDAAPAHRWFGHERLQQTRRLRRRTQEGPALT